MKSKSISFRQGAFTLIELLVVIAIIALLASIVLVALNGARIKARDAKRIGDLNQMGVALQLYYNDIGNFPLCGEWTYSTDANWTTTGCLQTALQPYMTKLPVDPVNNNSQPWGTGNYSYSYGYVGNGSDYDLVGQLEQQTNPDTCQYKHWIFHAAGSSWCGGYSPYMIADH